MRRSLLATACTFTALAIGGCGDEDEGGDAGAELAHLAPADAPIYAEAVIRPEGEQREELEAALGTLLGVEDPGALIIEQLDEESAEEGTGISYEEDVLPWLGKRAAFFATEFDRADAVAGAEGIYAILIETTDPEAAIDSVRESIEADGGRISERTYEGVEYILEAGEEFGASGIVGDHLVGGTEAGFKAAVDAAAGETLADSTELPENFDRLGSDVVAALYADPAAVLDQLEASGQLAAEQRESFEAQLGVGTDAPFTASLGASSSTFSFEASGAQGASTAEAAPELLAGLPAESWLAAALGEGTAEAFLDGAVEGFEEGLQTAPAIPPRFRGGLEAYAARELGLDLRELARSVDEIGFYIRGTSIFDLGGALIVETSDEEAILGALEPLREALEREPSFQLGPLDVEGEGFEVAIAGAPVEVPVVVRDGHLVAGLGSDSIEEALSVEEPIGDSDAFSAAAAALGSDVEPVFFLGFEPMAELIESTGQAEGVSGYAEAQPYLDALDFLAAGQSLADGMTAFRLTLGLDE